ncbi:IS110 family transposase [Endozoicomonas sp. SCSIO W0465]|uniref:IS110 family transposase n=1 Tax=Endozoicomonas sp. SCSIO W0465 TaxID=2918516 RepID=UPI002075CE50|nr:IS110 family transposase [Endozoicomonas sp. SCSIO W0465]USE36233.1 IS110 family transposase [Endozoicomonas sp. SCSIO W0465]
MEMVTNFVGVDVASRWLDICLHNGSVERIDNSLTAITEWVASLPRATAIAMEVTGRYHSLLASVAFQHGHTVYVLNPRAVYHYAAGIGRRQKSDKADAAIIRRYLSNEHDSLKPWRPATANQELIN